MLGFVVVDVWDVSGGLIKETSLFIVTICAASDVALCDGACVCHWSNNQISNYPRVGRVILPLVP